MFLKTDHPIVPLGKLLKVAIDSLIHLWKGVALMWEWWLDLDQFGGNPVMTLRDFFVSELWRCCSWNPLLGMLSGEILNCNCGQGKGIADIYTAKLPPLH